MNINDPKFPQQEAPEKNTDKAFVQVGNDGQPVIPTEKAAQTTDAKKVAIEEEQSKK